MKYNNLLVVGMLCAGFLSGSIFCAPTKSRQYFEGFLEDSSYAPHVIKYLREEYTESVSDINDILEHHYISEYRRATENKQTRMEKIRFLDRMQEHLILTPSAIEIRQEGPVLMETDDGSDRGGLGLRVQALQKVRGEIESAQD